MVLSSEVPEDCALLSSNNSDALLNKQTMSRASPFTKSDLSTGSVVKPIDELAN